MINLIIALSLELQELASIERSDIAIHIVISWKSGIDVHDFLEIDIILNLLSFDQMVVFNQLSHKQVSAIGKPSQLGGLLEILILRQVLSTHQVRSIILQIFAADHHIAHIHQGDLLPNFDQVLSIDEIDEDVVGFPERSLAQLKIKFAHGNWNCLWLSRNISQDYPAGFLHLYCTVSRANRVDNPFVDSP